MQCFEINNADPGVDPGMSRNRPVNSRNPPDATIQLPETGSIETWKKLQLTCPRIGPEDLQGLQPGANP